ncbi:MAG: hypothetical protein ACRDHN_04750, partial [Thermomicrobiales bacterium]
AWNKAEFEKAKLGADPTGVDKASQVSWILGNTWGMSTHSADFTATYGGVNQASIVAWTLGGSWSGTVFSASFDVDITNLEAKAERILQIYRDIADNSPHSPAKKGPLKDPISFGYIADDLQATMDRMGPLAQAGMAGVASAMGRSVGPDVRMPVGAGAPNGVTVVQHNYQVTPPALTELMKNAEAGGRVGRDLARELQTRRGRAAM